MHVTGIYVKFIGEANVKWTKRRRRKSRHGRDEDNVTDFTAREDYFSINQDVIRSDDGNFFWFMLLLTLFTLLTFLICSENKKKLNLPHGRRHDISLD